jgi:hypothetical protein
MATQRRAKVGGEVGMNGEHYPGGTFLPRTTLGKMAKPARKAGSGKEEIEPYRWEVPPAEGLRSLFAAIGGIYGRYDHGTGKFTLDVADQTLRFYGLDRAECQANVDRFNRGERWFAR